MLGRCNCCDRRGVEVALVKPEDLARLPARVPPICRIYGALVCADCRAQTRRRPTARPAVAAWRAAGSGTARP